MAPGNSFEVAGPKLYIMMVDRMDMKSYKWEPTIECQLSVGSLEYVEPEVASRVSTEVHFLLPAEYGIFLKTYGIPRYF